MCSSAWALTYYCSALSPIHQRFIKTQVAFFTRCLSPCQPQKSHILLPVFWAGTVVKTGPFLLFVDHEVAHPGTSQPVSSRERRLTWVTRGWVEGGGDRGRHGCWKELSNGPFLFRLCLPLSCHSVLFKPHNEVQSCRRLLLLRPSTPSSSSFRHIISLLNWALAESSGDRWNWNVHKHLTILCSQEIRCPLCLFCCSLVKLGAMKRPTSALSACLLSTDIQCLQLPLPALF